MSADTIDRGLGNYALTLSGAASGGGSKIASCSYGSNPGTPATNITYACPLSFGANWTFRLREGENRLSVSAQDIVGNNSSTATITPRVDRTDPYAVDLSGPLVLREGRGVGASSMKLRAVGRDVYSAVRRLELLVDGQAVDASMAGVQVATQGDPGPGAAMDRELDFDSGSLGEGKHRITVRATDGVGRTRDSRAVDVIVDRTKPALSRVEGTVRQPSVGTGELEIRAEDPGPVPDTAGVATAEVFITDSSGQTRRVHAASQDAASAPLTTTYRLSDTDTTLSQGRADVRVTAVDGSGNPATDGTFETIIDRDEPQLTTSGPLTQVGGTTLAADSYRLDISATDGSRSARSSERAGVTSVEVAVDDETVERFVQPCDAGSCSIDRSWTLDQRRFPGGPYVIRVTATDAVGHEDVETMTVNTRCCLGLPTVRATTPVNTDTAFGDVNADGLRDLVSRERATGAVSVYLHDGERFGSERSWGSWSVDHDLRIADVNGDEKGDLVGLSLLGADVRIARSDGSRFASDSDTYPWNQTRELHVGDLDGHDGGDLVGYDRDTGALTIRFSNGGGFEPESSLGSVPVRSELRLADVDGDEIADVTSRDRQTGRTQVAPVEDGTLSALAEWAPAGATGDAFVEDVDGDRAADLLLRDRSSGEVTLRRSVETRFGDPQSLGSFTTTGLGTVFVLDADGDDHADLVERGMTGEIRVAVTNVRAAVTASDQDPVDAADVLYEDDNDLGLSTAPSGTARAAAAPTKHNNCASGARMLLSAQEPSPLEAGSQDAQTRDLLYQRYADLGICVIRMNIYWGTAQNGPGSPLPYNWTEFDAAIDEAQRRGFQVRLTLTSVSTKTFIDECNTKINSTAYACAVAKPRGQAPNVAEFGDFVFEAVKHFSVASVGTDHHVRHFSIWNEPNVAKFLAAGSAMGDSDRIAEIYGDLYRTGWARAKEACSCAFVYIGELSENSRGKNDPMQFLRRAVETSPASELPVRTHGLAMHPYQHEFHPSKASKRANTSNRRKLKVGIGDLRYINDTLTALAREKKLLRPDGKRPPIRLTEFGYFNQLLTQSKPLASFHTDRERALWLVDALNRARKSTSHVTEFLIYKGIEQTPEDAPGDTLSCGTLGRNVRGAPATPRFDTGFMGPNLEFLPSDVRCYGRDPSNPGSRTLNHPQSRDVYCSLWRWAGTPGRNYKVGPTGCPTTGP